MGDLQPPPLYTPYDPTALPTPLSRDCIPEIEALMGILRHYLSLCRAS